MGINIKSSQNAYEMHKFVNFRNLTKKTEKKNYKNCLKNSILVRPTWYSKKVMDTQLTYQSSAENKGTAADSFKVNRLFKTVKAL